MRLKNPRNWTLADLYPDIPPEHRKALWESRKQLLRVMWRVYKRTHKIASGEVEDEAMNRFFNSDQFPDE